MLPGSGGIGADRSEPRASLDELIKVFQTNEVRADKLYFDKEVEVTGRVARVIHARFGRPDQGDEDRYTVELQTKPLDISRIVVLFFFDKTERDSLADLKPDQEVTIRGRCIGLSIYTGDYRNGGKDYTELRFRKCKIVEAK
jgi:hypothetical protein